MAPQKRAINGNHYTFDPRSVIGQAEQVTSAAHTIARTADEVWQGASEQLRCLDQASQLGHQLTSADLVVRIALLQQLPPDLSDREVTP